jgi:hypothetical protein
MLTPSHGRGRRFDPYTAHHIINNLRDFHRTEIRKKEPGQFRAFFALNPRSPKARPKAPGLSSVNPFADHHAVIHGPGGIAGLLCSLPLPVSPAPSERAT